MKGVSTPSPTAEPEPRWQQPAFGAEPVWNAPDAGEHQVPLPAVVPSQVFTSGGAGLVRPLRPASPLETLAGTIASLVWPIAFVLIIFAHVPFLPAVAGAIVLGMVFRRIKRDLKRQRLAEAQGPDQPPQFPSAPDLR
jgi:hypothetical protein